MIHTRVTVFADIAATRYVRTVNADEARRLMRDGQVASITDPGKKVRAVYLTGKGGRPASPMSGAFRQELESGWVWAMRLKTSDLGTIVY
jgi:hypothetical protein